MNGEINVTATIPAARIMVTNSNTIAITRMTNSNIIARTRMTNAVIIVALTRAARVNHMGEDTIAKTAKAFENKPWGLKLNNKKFTNFHVD